MAKKCNMWPFAWECVMRTFLAQERFGDVRKMWMRSKSEVRYCCCRHGIRRRFFAAQLDRHGMPWWTIVFCFRDGRYTFASLCLVPFYDRRLTRGPCIRRDSTSFETSVFGRLGSSSVFRPVSLCLCVLVVLFFCLFLAGNRFWREHACDRRRTGPPTGRTSWQSPRLSASSTPTGRWSFWRSPTLRKRARLRCTRSPSTCLRRLIDCRRRATCYR